jgi:O-antigen ligase
VTFLLASTSLWSLSRHDTLRESATFASVLVIVSFAVVRLRAEPLGSGLLGALAVLVPGMLVVTIAVIVGDHSRAVAEGGGVSGFVNGPNALGLLVALSLAFLLAHRWVAERWSLLGLTMGVVAFVVTLSASRTGYVALLAALLVYETGRRRWPRLALGLCAALAGAALAVVWAPDVPTLGRPLADRAQVTELFGGGRPAGQSLFGALTGARDEAWREAVALLPRRPLLGSGFGTGSDVFEHDGVRSRFRNFVGAFDPHANVHEAYLQVLLELGIPGGIVFLAPLLAAFGATLAGLQRGWRSRLEGACGATLAASLVCALFESVFAGFGAMTLLTWLAAAGVGLLPLLEGE